VHSFAPSHGDGRDVPTTAPSSFPGQIDSLTGLRVDHRENTCQRSPGAGSGQSATLRTEDRLAAGSGSAHVGLAPSVAPTALAVQLTVSATRVHKGLSPSSHRLGTRLNRTGLRAPSCHARRTHQKGPGGDAAGARNPEPPGQKTLPRSSRSRQPVYDTAGRIRSPAPRDPPARASYRPPGGTSGSCHAPRAREGSPAVRSSVPSRLWRGT
jgi:hypothetical protein